MHLQIIELDRRGHRLHHVGKLIKAVQGWVSAITVSISSESVGSPEYELQIAPAIGGRIGIDSGNEDMRAGVGTVSFGLRYSRAVRAALDRVGPDYVWMPTGDIVTQAMGLSAHWGERALPRGLVGECILHRCSPAYPAATRLGRARSGLIGRLLQRAPWRRMHVVDRLAYEWMCRVGGFAAEVGFLPDPVLPVAKVSKAEARRRLAIPVDGRYIGMVGVLDGHRNVEALLRGFRGARLGKSDRVLLVGECSPEIARLVGREERDSRLEGRIVRIGRFVAEWEFGMALSAMDVVCTLACGHVGISNTLIAAQFAERPVLGCVNGWQGLVIPLFGLGWCCDITDEVGLSKAIEESLGGADRYELTEGGRRLLRFHSDGNYAAWVSRGVRAEVGGADAVECLSWDWVVGRHGSTRGHARGDV